MRSKSRAAQIVATIVKARTRQLELRLQANRHGGQLTGERLYRAGEVEALLADLRAELRGCEHLPDIAVAANPDAVGG